MVFLLCTTFTVIYAQTNSHPRVADTIIASTNALTTNIKLVYVTNVIKVIRHFAFVGHALRDRTITAFTNVPDMQLMNYVRTATK